MKAKSVLFAVNNLMLIPSGKPTVAIQPAKLVGKKF